MDRAGRARTGEARDSEPPVERRLLRRRGSGARVARARVRHRGDRAVHIGSTSSLPRRRTPARRTSMKLGIVYHMPFWTADDGSLWEIEGSFARYVDSLAPYFDEVSLCVPVFDRPQPAGTRVRASNVRLAPLPYFAGPKQFYRSLPGMAARIRRWVRDIDMLHCR